VDGQTRFAMPQVVQPDEAESKNSVRVACIGADCRPCGGALPQERSRVRWREAMLQIALRGQFGDLVGGELAPQKTVETLAELETRAAQ
jgi:hypothetical protein